MAASSAAPAVSSRRWAALALLCAAQFMVVLDVSIVNVALPSMQADLGLSPARLQWVVTAYSLLFGGFLLLGGRLGDLFGRRRIFVVGLVLFTLASLVGGLAQSGLMLIVARALQGFAAALLSPAVLSLINTTFAEGSERNRALGVYGAVAAAGFSTGVILGGLLTELFSWQWVLFVNVPIGIAAVALTPVLIPERLRATRSGGLDLLGALLITAGIGSLVYGFSEAENAGWGSLQTALSVVVAATLIGLFVLVESRVEEPLVPLEIFRKRTLVGANAVAFVFGVAMASSLFILTLYLQGPLGYSPIATGFAFLPHALIVVAASQVMSRATNRMGVKPGMVLGTVVLTAGLLLMTFMSPVGNYLTVVLPSTLLTGLGVACLIVTAAIAATSGIRDDQQGLASGLFNTSQQVGSALGLAVLVAVASAGTEALGGEGVAAVVGGYRYAMAGAAVFATLGVLVTLFVVRTDQCEEAASKMEDAEES